MENKTVVNAMMVADPVLPSYTLSEMSPIGVYHAELPIPEPTYTHYQTYRYHTDINEAEVYVATTEPPPTYFQIVEDDHTIRFTAVHAVSELQQQQQLALERELMNYTSSYPGSSSSSSTPSFSESTSMSSLIGRDMWSIPIMPPRGIMTNRTA